MVFAYSVSGEHGYIDTKRLDSSPRVPIGTRLVNQVGEFSYACAGEDIGARMPVEPGLSVTLAFSRKTEKFADIVYGKVIAVIGDPTTHSGILGWPEVDVKKGQYFWIHQCRWGQL